MNYFKESFEEMKKVTWPTNNQAIKISIITVVFTILATLVITAFDFSFKSGYDALTDLSPKAQADRAAQQNQALEDLPFQLDSNMIQATDSDGNPVDVNINQVETPSN